MKSQSSLLLLAVVMTATPRVRAQTSVVQAPVAPTSAVTASAPAVAPSIAAYPSISLNLQWNETNRTFTVPLGNPGSSALTILGVQTTPNLFVVNFPESIAPKSSGTFTLLYYSRSGTNVTADFLDVLTSQGEQVVQVNHNRQQTVQFNPASLQWKQGAAPTPQSVVLTVAANTSVPQNVTVFGVGNKAQLLPLGGGNYKVLITPASTATPGAFAAIVNFSPALPGVVALVNCSIVSGN